METSLLQYKASLRPNGNGEGTQTTFSFRVPSELLQQGSPLNEQANAEIKKLQDLETILKDSGVKYTRETIDYRSGSEVRVYLDPAVTPDQIASLLEKKLDIPVALFDDSTPIGAGSRGKDVLEAYTRFSRFPHSELNFSEFRKLESLSTNLMKDGELSVKDIKTIKETFEGKDFYLNNEGGVGSHFTLGGVTLNVPRFAKEIKTGSSVVVAEHIPSDYLNSSKPDQPSNNRASSGTPSPAEDSSGLGGLGSAVLKAAGADKVLDANELQELVKSKEFETLMQGIGQKEITFFNGNTDSVSVGSFGLGGQINLRALGVSIDDKAVPPETPGVTFKQTGNGWER